MVQNLVQQNLASYKYCLAPLTSTYKRAEFKNYIAVVKRHFLELLVERVNSYLYSMKNICFKYRVINTFNDVRV